MSSTDIIPFLVGVSVSLAVAVPVGLVALLRPLVRSAVKVEVTAVGCDILDRIDDMRTDSALRDRLPAAPSAPTQLRSFPGGRQVG